MNHASALAVVAALALLVACSPAPQQTAETDTDKPRPAVTAMAEPEERDLPPVLDAEGNELDPELAEAVREKMAENAPVESEEDPDAEPAE